MEDNGIGIPTGDLDNVFKRFYLCDAAEALCLLPDIAHELPEGLPLHVLVLEDGVRQQADGGEGRLETTS